MPKGPTRGRGGSSAAWSSRHVTLQFFFHNRKKSLKIKSEGWPLTCRGASKAAAKGSKATLKQEVDQWQASIETPEEGDEEEEEEEGKDSRIDTSFNPTQYYPTTLPLRIPDAGPETALALAESALPPSIASLPVRTCGLAVLCAKAH